MNCNTNCSCAADNNVIQFIMGTTVNLSFDFDEDVSTYTDAKFVIRKNYDSAPIINKTISITEAHQVNIQIEKTETENYNDFENGKTSATNIWGLDLLDSNTGEQINVFPQVGEAAPLCIIYKHVV